MNRNIAMIDNSKIRPTFGSELWSNVNPFIVSGIPRSYRYNVYLMNYLENPEELINIIELLDRATEDDLIVFHINSGGGNVNSLMSLLYAMQRCQAELHAVVSGIVASAATFVLLACDSFEMMDYTEVLCHSASFGSYGKSQDVVDQVKFTHDQMEGFMREYYRHLFTEEELDDIIRNKREFLLTTAEFYERYQKRIDKVNEENEVSAVEQNELTDKLLRGLTKNDLIRLIQGEISVDENGEIIERG